MQWILAIGVLLATPLCEPVQIGNVEIGRIENGDVGDDGGGLNNA